MYEKVSPELQEKISCDLKRTYNMYGKEIGLVTFTIQEENIFNECMDWVEAINERYTGKKHGGSLRKFLHYEYIKPIQVLHFIVIFEYEINKNPSWQDWFIIREGEEDASKFIT